MHRAIPLMGRLLSRLALIAIVVALLPYAWGPIYRFPDPPPFSGTELRNPYASLTGTWQRANLHAHGYAWRGFTNGQQSDQAVVDRYHALGYAVSGVSDYQHIAAFDGLDTPPLYEHGFNVGKIHQLAIGAHAVEWLDFPLWQSLSNQQYVIDRVKRKADLVGLNHPSSRDAYDDTALRSLTGYDLIEVVNGPFTAEDSWDAALSSGHAVWAMANDDTHDLTDPRRLAVGWNMIDAPSASTSDIISALRIGRSYAVLRTGPLDAASQTTLESVQVRDGTITVTVRGTPSTIAFVGQDGAVRRTVRDVNTAAYLMTESDTYVRTVVTTPQTVLYLNPIIRWNGAQLPAPAATVDAAWTWLLRGSVVLGCLMLLLAVRWRHADVNMPARPVLAAEARKPASPPQIVKSSTR